MFVCAAKTPALSADAIWRPQFGMFLPLWAHAGVSASVKTLHGVCEMRLPPSTLAHPTNLATKSLRITSQQKGGSWYGINTR
jgi:hypothetical protein